MSTFNLQEEVGQLEYNFEPYGSRGTIPEPSAMQIQGFRQALGELYEATANLNTPKSLEEDPEGYVKRMSEFLSKDTTEDDEKLLHIVADVCSSQPSFDDLVALPFRARQAFLGWLTGTLLVPEAQRPATST